MESEKVTYEEYVKLIDKFKKERTTLKYNHLIKFSGFYDETLKEDSDYAEILTRGYLSLDYDPARLYLSFFEDDEAQRMLEHLMRTNKKEKIMGDEESCLESIKSVIFFINDFVFAIIMKYLGDVYDIDIAK